MGRYFRSLKTHSPIMNACKSRAEYMYHVMHTQYTIAENERKLFQVATEIANEQTGRSLGVVQT
jgi:hypothetical protein